MTTPSNGIIVPAKVFRTSGTATVSADADWTVTLSNNGDDTSAEVILDYGYCQGGVPTMLVQSATGTPDEIIFRSIYSETIGGIDTDKGDGPLFLFSSAMDSYRSVRHSVRESQCPLRLEAHLAQRSQRYQKLSLVTPDSTVVISHVGFQSVRPKHEAKCSFKCSDEVLNQVWRDGVHTVDMCTVDKEETSPSWEVTELGTRVHGGHWAPCRHGTRWKDNTTTFEVFIEKGGASWGTHMVVNGVIFCIDLDKRCLMAFEGLSDEGGIFPTLSRGSWELPEDIALAEWLSIETASVGPQITVRINRREIGVVQDLSIHPILGGENNTGSVAFGGPQGWKSTYRALKVVDGTGNTLYDNHLSLADKSRTFADFQVGTNSVACTIDGAKRDRACFGGDLFVMGRSIAYSTQTMEAIAGSIKLLTSHQLKDGYLGNLCPIQAPVHEMEDEPPTYAFYSLSYALLLVVAIKEYWMHTGDRKVVDDCFGRLVKLMEFASSKLNHQGLVEAPPPISMTWFPMGGPVFGVSTALNLAFFNSLGAMAMMSLDKEEKDMYYTRAEKLRQAIREHLWNSDAGVLRMSNTLPADGICQDVNGYAVSLGVAPNHAKQSDHIHQTEKPAPLAFRGLGKWDKSAVLSPYATGFAVEALFSRQEGHKALDLIKKVWGLMSDSSNPNYSGGHWEAMKQDGTPFVHDISLMHGWSTWPVFLLPQYVAGLRPLAPGWKEFAFEPVLAGLDFVSFEMDTPHGLIDVGCQVDETTGSGVLTLTAPKGTLARVKPPNGWLLQGSDILQGTSQKITVTIERKLKDNAKSADFAAVDTKVPPQKRKQGPRKAWKRFCVFL